MEKTFILRDYIGDNIRREVERTSFPAMKEFVTDACKAMNSDGIDTSTLDMVIASIPKESLQEENIALVYEALEQYCDVLDKDDPKKTVYKKKYSHVADHLDDIQSGLYNMMLKIKFAKGYDYSRIYVSSDILEVRDQVWRFQREISDFKDLLHVVLEGIKSGSTGPDENENALSSLYAQFEQITDRGEEIKEEYFS